MPGTKRKEVKRHKAIPFKDCNTYRGNSGHYYATNEEPKLFNDLLGDARFERAAAICSGGEIAFFVLLPRVEKELVLVDHNYETMQHALMKWLIIQTEGGRRAHELLSTPNTELIGIVKKLAKRMPEEMRNGWKIRQRDPVYGVHGERTANNFCNSRDGVNGTIRREWQRVKAEDIEAIENDLNKIQFLHGDIVEDLKRRKPFDCLYLSNCMEYSGRKGIPTWDACSQLVVEGGVILTTGGRYRAGEEKLKVEGDIRGHTHWNHRVLRTPTASVVPVPA